MGPGQQLRLTYFAPQRSIAEKHNEIVMLQLRCNAGTNQKSVNESASKRTPHTNRCNSSARFRWYSSVMLQVCCNRATDPWRKIFQKMSANVRNKMIETSRGNDMRRNTIINSNRKEAKCEFTSLFVLCLCRTKTLRRQSKRKVKCFVCGSDSSHA